MIPFAEFDIPALAPADSGIPQGAMELTLTRAGMQELLWKVFYLVAEEPKPDKLQVALKVFVQDDIIFKVYYWREVH